MTERPTGWRYLELTYDPREPVRVSLDGVPLDSDAPLGQVVGGLGIDGWEMVSSAAGEDTRQVLWFRRPIEPSAPDRDAQPSMDQVALRDPAGSAPDPGATSVRVTLVGLGRGRSDPHQRRLVIDAVASLTGESGWRATRIVDKAPRVVVDQVTAQEADRVRRALEDLGAIVEVS